MVKTTHIQSLPYTLDELRPIRSSVDQYRSHLVQFIQRYKSMNLLELETRLLGRCVYKNWNARRAELGIQASRRTVRLLERLLSHREENLEQILHEFKADDVKIYLPSRGTLHQLVLRLEESSLLLTKIQHLAKTTIDRLRLESSALEKAEKEFTMNVKKSFQMANRLDYVRFLSKAAARRQPSAIREVTQLFARSPPSTISFGSGSPNPSLFPFKDATITLTNGSSIQLDPSAMAKALQYLPTPGQANLLEWLKKLQSHYHSPHQFQRYDLCVTNGSMEGLSKVFELVINPTEPILVDSPCYSGSLDFLRGYGADIVSVETDSHGMSANNLVQILSNWSNSNSLPKVLYTIPNGSNPTGASMTLDRKKDIYSIAQKYNLLIIEDDPYFFLQFTKSVPSFLSMDIDGRVIRLDSMSKVLSAGMRLGFVTAPIPLWQRLVYHQQVTSMHASSLSQMIALQLFDKWGLPGFHEHTQKIAAFYQKQKTLMIDAINTYLKDMVTFNEPTAGMFVWLKLNGIEDSRQLIYEKALAEEVLFIPGNAFFSDQSKSYPFVRASYSLCTPEQIDTGIARFGKVLHNELNY